MPPFGVTVMVTVHVPAFNVFTDDPLTLQTFADAAATFSTTFDDDAIVIRALVARHDLPMVFPFFTEHVVEPVLVEEVDGGFVVGGRVVVDVVVVDEGIATHEAEPCVAVVVPVAHTVWDVAPVPAT